MGLIKKWGWVLRIGNFYIILCGISCAHFLAQSDVNFIEKRLPTLFLGCVKSGSFIGLVKDEAAVDAHRYDYIP
jgi:hypothetical protein